MAWGALVKTSLIHGNSLLAFDDLSLAMTKGPDDGPLLAGSGWDGEGKTFGEVAGLKTGDLLHLRFKRLGTVYIPVGWGYSWKSCPGYSTDGLYQTDDQRSPRWPSPHFFPF